MTGSFADFAEVFEVQAGIVFERSAAEFRAGRAVVIDAPSGSTIVAALDTVSPRFYAALVRFSGASLVLPAIPGHAMVASSEGPTAYPLTGLSQEDALRTAAACRVRMLGGGTPAGANATAALDICRHALLRPALLSAPLEARATLPSGFYRTALERLVSPAADRAFACEVVSEAGVPLAGNIQTRFLVLRGGPVQRDQVAIIIGTPDPSNRCRFVSTRHA